MNADRYHGVVLLLIASFGAVSVACSQPPGKSVIGAFTERINDSISVQVKLHYNERGVPEYYFCHIDTPVCEEGLCKAMVLDVYWDVLGNFLKYELPPNEVLTKADHLPFTANDHEKLRAILADRGSILRDYPVKDLVDRRMITNAREVDAVSAATRVEVKDAIVSGAVYSTYVLWYIVNGRIADRIEAYTRPLMTDSLILEMFRSDNLYYQYYALNHYRSEDSLTYLPEVIRLVRNGTDYIPYFAIEKLPEWVWDDDHYQLDLMQGFQGSDFKLKNAFLEKLSRREVSSAALDILISGIDTITDKQRVKVLLIAEANKGRLSKTAMKRIERYHGSK